jgi:hypothetical protein
MKSHPIDARSEDARELRVLKNERKSRARVVAAFALYIKRDETMLETTRDASSTAGPGLGPVDDARHSSRKKVATQMCYGC